MSFRRSLVGLALAQAISGCTVVGLGAGALVASSRNGDPQVEQGLKPRTSVGKSMALGAALGFVVDIGFVVLAISQGGAST